MNLRAYFVPPPLRRHIERYAQTHRHRVNQALHYIGIPLAVIAALGALAKVRMTAFDGPDLLQPNLGLALLVVGCGFYLWVSPGAGVLLLIGGIAGYVAGSPLPLSWLGAMAAFAFALHTFGHYVFEKKPPAFFSRPMAALEAPAWLVARLTGVDPQPSGEPGA